MQSELLTTLPSYDQNGQWQNLTLSNVRKLRDLQKPKSKWVPRREWRRWQIKTRCTFAAHLTRCGALSFHSISLSRRCKVFDTWAVTIFHRIQRNGFFLFSQKSKIDKIVRIKYSNASKIKSSCFCISSQWNTLISKKKAFNETGFQ